jgi:WD40 repeat protein
MRGLRFSFSFALVLMLAVWDFTAFAAGQVQNPPTEPILRIETEMHTAKTLRIGVDAENRFLVTASDDKTVRVWEITAGRTETRLLKVLRPPVGAENEGKIYAAAISPDGRTIACGGHTGWEWSDHTHSIYLFDRESGNIIKTITGLPGVIGHLAYSKDGKYLAAGLGGKNGIRVFGASSSNSNPADYFQAAQDRDYGDRVNGADFDEGGRLVISSSDGYIRLYDAGFRLIAKEKARGGNQPYQVGFSPDGSKIAVGFNDSAKVDVFSGGNLSWLYSPDTGGVNGYLSGVAWSSDIGAGGRTSTDAGGRTPGVALSAGGTYKKGGVELIRRWDNGGQGGYKDLTTGADNTIHHILPLKDGGMAFVAGGPSFGIINEQGQVTLFKGSSIADYRDNRDGFLVSNDGFTVQFGYESHGKSPAVFSVSDRSLTIGSVSGGAASARSVSGDALKPSITSTDGIRVTEWKNEFTPKLNGRALKLKQYERSRSLAVSPIADGPGKGGFLLGTEWNLRWFDGNGNERWRVPVEAAWGVNISGDGRTAVAAFGDGTIRWYRINDGKEILAFFPHADKKRWVMWTPSGYYDAAPGSDDIIGWHINNGKDRAANFYPVSKFRAKYYRPDVIAKVIETFEEDKAVELANAESGQKKQEVTVRQMLPPVVNIISPRDGAEVSSNQFTLRYGINTPSGEPVTNVKILVDGRPISAGRGIGVAKKEVAAKDDGTKEIAVTIPEKDCEVSVIAENKYSASDPSTIRLRWRGAAPPQKDEFVIKPKLYVLAIGVSKYNDKDIQLKYAAKDARDFAAALKKQEGGLYREVVVKILVDEKATRDEIMDGFDWLRKETTSRDVAMVFLAGHGVNDSSGIFYYLPVNTDTEKLMRTGVAFSDIKNTVASLAGKAVLFIDTCHSGNVMGGRRGTTDTTGMINDLTSAENGVVVFASSTGRQYSLEDEKWGNGAFTKALIEGIGGKADYTGKGKITINSLDLYMAERVKELTGGKQSPTTTKPQTIQDFPIAVKK